MSEEFDPSSEPNFSSFWPLLILIVGLMLWFGFQDYELNKQRNNLNSQVQANLEAYNEAQNISTHYVALMKDLVHTAQTDQAAADIVKAAIQAGLIHVQPNATNSAGTPAAPAPDAAK
jgi:hypothetical protein